MSGGSLRSVICHFPLNSAPCRLLPLSSIHLSTCSVPFRASSQPLPASSDESREKVPCVTPSPFLFLHVKVCRNHFNFIRSHSVVWTLTFRIFWTVSHSPNFRSDSEGISEDRTESPSTQDAFGPHPSWALVCFNPPEEIFPSSDGKGGGSSYFLNGLLRRASTRHQLPF